MLKFYYGAMGAGKSALLLQMAYNLRQRGEKVRLFTIGDRTGESKISSRMGLCEEATLLDPNKHIAYQYDFYNEIPLFDEIQFAPVELIDQLANLECRGWGDIYCFGLATDFRSKFFPASQRLFELADECSKLQLEVKCWCGQEGRFNARIIDGEVVTDGPQILVGDIDKGEVFYRVLCLEHFLDGDAGL